MHRNLLAALALLAACRPSADDLKRTLKQHPEVLAEAIREHPTEIMDALRAAADSYQKVAQGRAAQAEMARIDRELANPRAPVVAAGRATRGDPSAPVMIVVYSDFQCPYCRRDVPVIQGLLQKYAGRVKVVLKQTPLTIHPHARAAAAMFEAVLRQGQDRAWSYHDLLFTNQERLGAEGRAYLDAAAREVGADLARAHRDAASTEVTAIIDHDLAEFQQFGFSGTPGFIVHGVMLDGAHPPEDFERIIDRALQRIGAAEAGPVKSP